MKHTSSLAIPIAIALSALLWIQAAYAQPAGAENNLIQGGHSGTWYDNSQPGHGLFVEVLDDLTSPTGREVLVAWFAYIDGRQVWLLGQGDVVPVDDGFRAVLEVWIFDGNDFPPRYDPDMTQSTLWGEIVLRFTGCHLAHLAWDSVLDGFGSGELELQRLTQTSGSICLAGPDAGEKIDDHGDRLATGTYLTNIQVVGTKVEGMLEEKGDVDVFVFTLPVAMNFAVYTLGPEDTDTFGTLYQVVGYQELKITSDDDSSVGRGFLIEARLEPGNYSVHVRGSRSTTTGPYEFYYQRNPR